MCACVCPCLCICVCAQQGGILVFILVLVSGKMPVCVKVSECERERVCFGCAMHELVPVRVCDGQDFASRVVTACSCWHAEL